MEKVVQQELADAPVAIKHSGIYKDIDKKYEDEEAAAQAEASGGMPPEGGDMGGEGGDASGCFVYVIAGAIERPSSSRQWQP